MIIKQEIILSQFANFRLDKWFKHNYPELSFITIAKLCRTGQIRLDGKRVPSPGLHLQAGQTLRFPLFETKASALKTGDKIHNRPQIKKLHQKLQEKLIYQDSDIIILDKPAGVAVQGGSKIPISINDTLPLWRQNDEDEVPRIVHRLDKQTSGVLILASNLVSAIELGQLFQERKVEKEYLAIVAGIPQQHEGIIDIPVAKVSGKKYEKVCPQRKTENHSEAITHYQVLATDIEKNQSLLLLKPKTGRMHQLRVHCSASGFPIVGDKKYGDFKQDEENLFLHAHRLLLPWHGQMLEFKAELPSYFAINWLCKFIPV